MTHLEKQRLADFPTNLFQELEEELMANIIRHCQDYGQPIATDAWLMRKLAEIGKLNQENIRIIAKATGLSQVAMEQMLTQVAEQVLGEIEPSMRQIARDGLAGQAVPVEQSRNVKQVMAAMQKQAKNTLNLCNTTMLYMARNAYQDFVQNLASTAQEIANKQGYMDILNKYTSAVLMGTQSRQQALRNCIRDFNEKGIPAFVDKRGRKWTPEAYINMAMRSTSNTVAAEIQMARAEDYGIDLVEVDSHSGARPKCARDQGKIFDRKNKSDKYPHWSSSSYGQPDGLLGINCRHHIWPYIEGVSIRRYFPTEDLEENDRLYKATQVQRALERDVRKQKRECMLYDQLGDKDGFEAAAVKLKAKEAKLRGYVNSHPNLHRRKDREQVVGFDRRVSAEAVGVSRRKQEKYKRNKFKVEGSIDSIHIISKRNDVDWNVLIGISNEHTNILNDIHYDLQSHMIKNKTEKVVIYGLSRNEPLSTNIGTRRDEVNLTKEMIQILKRSSENDIILSHVHPGLSSFSRADIDQIINFKSIKALTVECIDGTKYILERGKYKSSVLGYWKYDKLFAQAEKEAQKLFPEFNSGDEQALEKIWPAYADKRNSLLAEKLGMQYRKVTLHEE